MNFLVISVHCVTSRLAGWLSLQRRILHQAEAVTTANVDQANLENAASPSSLSLSMIKKSWTFI